MIEALTIAHVLFASAWFGPKLLIPRDVHDSIRDVEGAPRFIARITRARRLGILSGLLTLGTGAWLTYEAFGLSNVPMRIWVGLGAVLLTFVVSWILARPAWLRIRAGLEAGDPASAAAGVPRYRQSILLENLLWILALCTMVIA